MSIETTVTFSVISWKTKNSEFMNISERVNQKMIFKFEHYPHSVKLNSYEDNLEIL